MADVELPEVGIVDRVRVDVPDWPGAISGSTTGSVLLEPPPPGTPWRIEEPPVVDGYFAEEAVEAMAMAPWADSGFRGGGVVVAVFDVQWFNAAVLSEELGSVESHDCELTRSCDVPMDTLRPRFSYEEGAHGVACAEVIADLAPEAELHLVRVNGPTSFENAVEWALRNEVDVVSMSMSFFNNSFYDGTGALADAAGHLAEGGTLLVTSAGNYAQEHWVGPWDDVDHDDWMDFPWGGSYLPIYANAGAATAFVSWDEYGDCGRNDFDVVAVNRDGEIVGRADENQDADADHCAPLERISIRAEAEDWYWLRIHRRRGVGGVALSVAGRGAHLYFTAPGGLADPAASTSAFSGGAVRASGYAHNDAESFSSYGPTHAGFFKPDIAGPDGLSSRIFGTIGFYGTSASTPAVAAAVAVAMSADPEATPREVADRLAGSALDAATAGQPPDAALGSGKVRLWSLDPEREGACSAGGGAMIAAPLLWWRGVRRRVVCRR